jgi:hypothetical protein
MIKNNSGQFIQFYNGNISTINQSELQEKFTEQYNSCIFFMTLSNIDSFLTEYRTDAEYFLPPNNLVRYDSSSNRLTITNSAITSSYFRYSGSVYYSTISTNRTYPGVGTIDNQSNGYFTIYSPLVYDTLVTIDPDLVSI